MSEFQEKNNHEGFEEVHMSHSTDEEEIKATPDIESSDSLHAVNVSKYDEKSDEQEGEAKRKFLQWIT
jgi:hypothetical protein